MMAPRARAALGLCAAAAAVGAEVLACHLALTRIPLGLAAGSALLGLHVGAAALSAEALRLRARGAPEGHAAVGLGLTLLVPVLGVVGALLLALFPPAVHTQAVADSQEQERARAMARLQAERRSEQVVDTDVQSIVDALKDPDLAVRLGAMDALRTLKGAAAVRLLKISRTNTAFDVRFRAVEALGEMSQRASDGVNEALQAVDEDVEDPERWCALGDAYAEYRDLGLEDAVMQQSLSTQAESCYRTAWELAPHEARFALRLASALERLELYEDAREVLSGTLGAGHADPASVYLGLARVAFRQGRVPALEGLSRQALRADRGHLAPDDRAALAYWAGEA
jgi:tetratricopeptide (TPR) repeat protein